MIHTLVYVACGFLVAYAIFKLGQASEVIRERDRMLDEREELNRLGPDGPPSRLSSIYDGEAEGALDSRPVLAAVEEPTGLRIVKP